VTDLPGERWLLCPQDPRYEVSDQGRVRRIAPGHGARVGRVLRPTIHRDSGRPALHLPDGERRCRQVFVARLVLMAFGRMPESGETAKHRNGDTRDCRFRNLYWSGDPTVRLVSHRCASCGQIIATPRRGTKRFCLPGENGDCWMLRHRAKSLAWWRANRSVVARRAA
jgi:hypothetical protein